MERIKKFCREHDDEINSALMIACGIGAMACAAIALHEIHVADGMRIKNIDLIRYEDGSEDEVLVYLMNGRTVGGPVRY